MRAPIAIFAHRRAGHLRQMLEALQACEGFFDSEVTIFVDGARTADEQGQVNAVRDLVMGLGLPNVTSSFRQDNLGLRRSIFSGVGEMCRKYGRVIVLEDDLVLSSSALNYFNSALDRYENVERVWSVSAYMYDVASFRHRERAIFLPFPHPWGWATWARAWANFDLDDPLGVGEMQSKAFQTAFNAFGVRDWAEMLALSESGKVNSWYIRWYYRMFRDGGLSVFPPRSLLENVGVSGEGGTHASRLNPYSLLVKRKPQDCRSVQLPDDVRVDYAAIDAIAASWDARVQKYISHLGRIKRSLRR